MVLNTICSRLKFLFLSIINILRRALCCFSRRRKQSSSECEILESVNVVTDGNSRCRNTERERDWNSWDDSPRTVEEHIEQYRKKLGRQTTPPPTEPEPDYFEDMTPKIRPPPQILIKSEPEQKTDFSRLEAKCDVPIAIAPDLEDWEDEDPGGWEELDSQKTKQLLREKRRELRAQRQAKSKEVFKMQEQLFERITTRL